MIYPKRMQHHKAQRGMKTSGSPERKLPLLMELATSLLLEFTLHSFLASPDFRHSSYFCDIFL